VYIMDILFILIAIQAFLGVIFVIAGGTKIFDPAKFVQIVLAYRLLPDHISRVTAIILPWLEVLVGALLVLDIVPATSATVACSLFLLFASAIGINLLRGRRDFSCGCFGADEGEPLNWGIVVRNLLLAVLAIAVVILNSRELFPRPASSIMISDRLVAISAGSSFFLNLILYQTFFTLRRSERPSSAEA
jgi:uncharacterized membrane protein YphA (DoxX/SURF4 family)